jgi:hypothetical protein
MEHDSQPTAGLPPEEAAAVAEYERLVNEGLEQAQQERRRIDDLTAKRIARDLDPGSGSLHELAETGVIPEWIGVDLESAQEVALDLEMESRLSWILALDEYCRARLIRSDLPGWDELGAE